MRRFLLIFDAAVAALALTMGLVQAVVCILYGFSLDLSPSLAKQMPVLLWSTAIFTVVGLLFLGCFWWLLRRRPGHAVLQVLVLASLVPAGLLLGRLLT